MTTTASPTAAELRRRNGELDAQLRALAAQVPAERLYEDPGNGEWTLSENLAHIGEFPRFFARDLAGYLDGHAGTMGRTHVHPGRQAAIDAAVGKGLEELQAGLDEALRELAGVMERLVDADLGRVTANVKYGSEPLIAFIRRYVIDHKAAHVDQLRDTLRRVGLPAPGGEV